MQSFRFQLAGPLDKIFPRGQVAPWDGALTALWGETVSFQIAYRADFPDGFGNTLFQFSVDAGPGVSVRMRRVGLSPSAYPIGVRRDNDYLTTEPGLYPDILLPMPEEGVHGVYDQWRSIWVDLTPEDGEAAPRPVTVRAQAGGYMLWEADASLRIVKSRLAPQRLIHTEWFYADCLADYYHVDAFSQEHWDILERFVATAARRGINMLLTPVFTPPLDTAPGGERTTVQLVDVRLADGKWSFGFERLGRFVDMALRCGIEYFEISHFFTQWGAHHAPKIIASTDTGERRVFGWETDAHGPEYEAFLRAFLPQLREWLRAKGILERSWFHISDEPTAKDLDSYRAGHACVAGALGPECKIVDALSEFEFYQDGTVSRPVVACDALEPFLEAEVPDLWTYYCVSQSIDVPNRFFAMPSARNRILGVLLYLYRMQGFLHWGYNFYNAQYSKAHINPFCVTDAGEAFPSGDPFLVYPGEGGEPLESIRMMVLDEALADLRALETLEGLTSRARVEQIVRAEAGMRLTFRQYPREASFLYRLRERINGEIALELIRRPAD